MGVRDDISRLLITMATAAGRSKDKDAVLLANVHLAAAWYQQGRPEDARHAMNQALSVLHSKPEVGAQDALAMAALASAYAGAAGMAPSPENAERLVGM